MQLVSWTSLTQALARATVVNIEARLTQFDLEEAIAEKPIKKLKQLKAKANKLRKRIKLLVQTQRTFKESRSWIIITPLRKLKKMVIYGVK